MCTGALDDEMPARNVTYGTPSPITNPSRWMMESVKSVPFGSFALHPSSLALAQFRAFSPSFPFFPRWRPGLCFSGSGILCCVLGERERVWKGNKRGFLLFFFLCVVLGKLLWCEDGEEQELQSASQKGEEQEPGTASEGTTH